MFICPSVISTIGMYNLKMAIQEWGESNRTETIYKLDFFYYMNKTIETKKVGSMIHNIITDNFSLI